MRVVRRDGHESSREWGIGARRGTHARSVSGTSHPLGREAASHRASTIIVLTTISATHNTVAPVKTPVCTSAERRARA